MTFVEDSYDETCVVAVLPGLVDIVVPIVVDVDDEDDEHVAVVVVDDDGFASLTYLHHPFHSAQLQPHSQRLSFLFRLYPTYHPLRKETIHFRMPDKKCLSRNKK
jgi:hypothetical protein